MKKNKEKPEAITSLDKKEIVEKEGYLDLLNQSLKILKDIGGNAIPYHEEKWAGQMYETQGNLETSIVNLKNNIKKMKGGKS